MLTYADFTRPQTVSATIGGAQTTVQLPVFGERPIVVNGIEAPACKF